MPFQLLGQFGLRKRIHLLEKDDSRGRVFSFLALLAQLVADFSGAKEYPLGVAYLRVGQNVQKVWMREVFDGRRSIGMTQHALGRENNQRFAPVPQRLPPQQMKILRRVRRLADLKIISCCELQETFDARARVLRSLALIAVRQQKNHA